MAAGIALRTAGRVSGMITGLDRWKGRTSMIISFGRVLA